MLPNILYLILYLPTLILARPPNTRLPPASTLHPVQAAAAAISAPTGDTINRTACFCASPQWVMDRNYGYYYRIDYHNAHLDRTYTLKPACKSELAIDIQEKYDPENKPVLQNGCLRSHVNDAASYCTGKQGVDRDVFCYTLAGGPEYDSWSFNGQLRTGLPTELVVEYSPEMVAEVCEESCKEHVSGMEMLKANASEVLEGYYNLVGQSLNSSVVFYPSIPDICEGCE